MKTLTAIQVFKPGGIPSYTYVDRKVFEEKLKDVKKGLSKLAVVTGVTKFGKTVLVEKIFPKDEVVWIDGGNIGKEDDFWSSIIDQLDGHIDEIYSESNSVISGLEGSIQGETNFIFMKGGAGAKKSESSNETAITARSKKSTYRTAANKTLSENLKSIIIDDFHYIDKVTQGEIVRFLKPFILKDLPVIIIAIPHKRYDTVKVEREMTGRIENISIPSWHIDELSQIAEKGFSLLNIDIDKKVIAELANEALGSPHLMQEFCRELCRSKKIDETKPDITKISITEKEKTDLYKTVAENTGRTMFEKLAKGPRKRTDRLERKLKNGETTDIYGLVLKSLSNIKPGTVSIDYDEIRQSIKSILHDETPKLHEISRVIERMAEIASSDETSAPVIEWDKEEKELHITDPFFAYFLRWGNLNKE